MAAGAGEATAGVAATVAGAEATGTALVADVALEPVRALAAGAVWPSPAVGAALVDAAVAAALPVDAVAVASADAAVAALPADTAVVADMAEADAAN
jgi:hypothetical protein